MLYLQRTNYIEATGCAYPLRILKYGWLSWLRLLDTAALWVRIQTSLKNTNWATYAKEWPTHSILVKHYDNFILLSFKKNKLNITNSRIFW
jgi:hypothetical protein